MVELEKNSKFGKTSLNPMARLKPSKGNIYPTLALLLILIFVFVIHENKLLIFILAIIILPLFYFKMSMYETIIQLHPKKTKFQVITSPGFWNYLILAIYLIVSFLIHFKTKFLSRYLISWLISVFIVYILTSYILHKIKKFQERTEKK